MPPNRDKAIESLFRAVGHLERCLLSIAGDHPELFSDEAAEALEQAVWEHRTAAETWLGHPIQDD